MKNRIIQAATKEIALRGLKFSIRALANQLGISTKTLYQHFASKEQIVASIVEQAIGQMKEREQQVMKTALPLKKSYMTPWSFFRKASPSVTFAS